MGMFNYIGLIFISLIMIPNIIFGIKNKDGFNNIYQNKLVETLEQISRFSCIGLMIINIPYLYYDIIIKDYYLLYIIVGLTLILVYLIGWIICWKKYYIFRSYLLSIIPSILFIFCGVMILYIPLIIMSLIFTYSHITISLKNAYKKEK